MTDAEAKQLLAGELRHVRQDRLDIARQRDLLLKAAKAALTALGQASQGVNCGGNIIEPRGARDGFYALRAAIAECMTEDTSQSVEECVMGDHCPCKRVYRKRCCYCAGGTRCASML